MANNKTYKTYCDFIREAIVEEMENNDDIIFLGEDIGRYAGAFGVSRGLIDKFGPRRIIETPISENSFMGVALGAALTGLRPIVEIMFMDFITLAMDQITNHIAKFHYIYGGQANIPIVIRTSFGAGLRYGATHSQSLESWFMHIPGIKIAVPSNPNDAKFILKYAIRDCNPWLFIEHKRLYKVKGMVDRQLDIPVGKARIINRGDACTIISYSFMVEECKKVIEYFKKEKGIHLELIDLRTLKPLDLETIVNSIKKTKKAIIVEEDCKTAGVGAEISALIMETCFDYLNQPVLRLASYDSPVPASPVLEDFVIPSYQRLVKEINNYLNNKQKF